MPEYELLQGLQIDIHACLSLRELECPVFLRGSKIARITAAQCVECVVQRPGSNRRMLDQQCGDGIGCFSAPPPRPSASRVDSPAGASRDVGIDTYPCSDAGDWRRVRIAPMAALPSGQSTLVALANSASNQTSEASFPIVVPEPGMAAGRMAGGLVLGWLGGTRGRSARHRTADRRPAS